MLHLLRINVCVCGCVNDLLMTVEHFARSRKNLVTCINATRFVTLI